MSAPDVPARYHALREALPSLREAAREASREAASHGGWWEAGMILEAAGALLRRQQALGPAPTEDMGRTLMALPREAVQAWLGALSEAQVEEALTHAGEAGLEAALAEEDEERELLCAEVLESLRARDALESQSVALARWEALAGEPSGPLTRQMQARLSALDVPHRARARLWGAANATRRAESALLDAGERSRAWWFSARADCDALVAALAGAERTSDSHLHTCPECQVDMQNAAPVTAPLPSHLDAEALWALDMDTASAGERARWTAHASRCMACADALAALALGEEAIEEALREEDAASGLPAARRDSRPQEREAARRSERRVLEERRDFRLLLMRERGSVRLLVQPMRTGAVASALVFLPPGRQPLRPRLTPEGYDFSLGEEGALRQRSVTVRLQLPGSGETWQRDFLL